MCECVSEVCLLVVGPWPSPLGPSTSPLALLCGGHLVPMRDAAQTQLVPVPAPQELWVPGAQPPSARSCEAAMASPEPPSREKIREAWQGCATQGSGVRGSAVLGSDPSLVPPGLLWLPWLRVPQKPWTNRTVPRWRAFEPAEDFCISAGPRSRWESLWTSDPSCPLAQAGTLQWPVGSTDGQLVGGVSWTWARGALLVSGPGH